MSFNLLDELKKFEEKGCRHLAIDVEVTPEIASLIINQFNYKGQRPRNRKHVAVLAEAMRRNEFREFTPIDFVVFDGTPHLVNGQHTLQAISYANKPIWLSLNFSSVDSESAIERNYSKHDNGRTRSIRDTMGNIGEELKLLRGERNTLSAAVGFINRGFRVSSGNMNTILQYESKDFEFLKSLMRIWGNEAYTFFRSMDSAPKPNKELFHRGAVLAVAMITIRHCGERAVEFWSDVAHDDGLRNGDPRKSLINWLRNNSCGKAPTTQHRAAIACWNAWFEGRNLLKVHVASETSLKILGTPIDISISDEQGKL